MIKKIFILFIMTMTAFVFYPQSFSDYSIDADMAMRKKDYYGCIENYNKAIDLKPDSYASYNNRGCAKIMLNRYKDALEDFSMAITIKSDFCNAYNNRAFCYLATGNYEAALNDFIITQKYEPKAKSYYLKYYLGISYYLNGKYQDASDTFKKYKELTFSYFDLFYYNIAVSNKISKKNLKDAMGLLAFQERAEPGDWHRSVTGYLRNTYSEHDLIRLAEGDNGKTILAYYLIGIKNLNNKDIKNARDFFTKCIEVKTDAYYVPKDLAAYELKLLDAQIPK